MDLPVVQGTLKSLLQHHSSKLSTLQQSAFFMVQLSHLYKTTGKTIALTRRTFVSEVLSLLLNMLSRFVRAFLLKSKSLLIPWLERVASPFYRGSWDQNGSPALQADSLPSKPPGKPTL